CKGVLFGEDGAVLCRERAEYTTADPFFDAFCAVVSRIAKQYPIRAIGLSSHGETVIPVGADCHAVYPALMNSDNRAVAQSASLVERLGRERIYQITGLPAHPMYSLPKIMWLRDNEPGAFAKTAKFCGVPEYIMGRLGLEPVSDYTIASRFMALDIRRHAWSDEILSAAGIDRSLLCETRQAGQVGGIIPHSAAAALGLHDGVTLTPAGHDQPCGSFGAGLTTAGAVLSAGSYECLTVVGKEPCPEAALRYSFNTYCHVCPGTYVTLAFFPAGMCVQYFTELLGGGEIKPTGPTGLLVTPHVVGACNPDWNPDVQGSVYGFRPGVSWELLMCGVYEGIACELKLNMDALERILPLPGTIRVHGGGVEKDWTLQLRADITGRSFQRLESAEAGCRGAALLAGVSLGIYKDYSEAAGTVKCQESRYVPNPAVTEQYLPQIGRYQKFRESGMNL
ncbi:MAG: FGGY family carbohydrate kinase, partial [Firmicutes bacterium]|nr:FGGY family carbohydrate kinase [Bacillota bacterium]